MIGNTLLDAGPAEGHMGMGTGWMAPWGLLAWILVLVLIVVLIVAVARGPQQGCDSRIRDLEDEVARLRRKIQELDR